MSNRPNSRLSGLPDAPAEDMRAPVRAPDPRAEAKARAAQIRESLIGGPEGEDKFYIPAELIPDGWTYEWKRHTTYGKEDPSYEISLARSGWTAVPTARHPSFMPSGTKEMIIVRDGMMLMERPQEITDELRRQDLQRARSQVKAKEEQLREAPPGHFERDDPKGRVAPKIKKNFEPIPITEE